MVQPAFTVSQALDFRRAVPTFDPLVEISHEELLRLLNTANLAPSSMNIQPWEYVVVTTAEDKARLRKVAMNQAKIESASAAVLVLGNLKQYEHAARIADGNIQRGYMPAEGKQGFIDRVHGAWADNAPLARDEAFRGSSLWSMAFMLAAAEAGWDTAPMSGFWPDQVVAEFGIPDSFIPIMIICIGRRDAEKTILERGERIPAEELIHVGNF